MTDEMKLQQAQKVFETLCRNLDEHEWHYKKDEEELKINCGASGEDLPMDLNIFVDADRQIVVLLSPMPFRTAEDKRLEMAVAISIINNRLVDGSFDYDWKSGRICFRMTTSFIGCEIGSELFSYMVMCSCATIDDYNDKLLMLSKGMLTLEQFMEA